MAGKRLGLGAWLSLATLFGCLLSAPASSMAQSGEEVPRTSWGASALGGVWDYRTATPTLVIETTGFDKRATFRGSGPALRLIERLTRVDADTLRYQYTVDDAASFTRPWTVDLPMKRGEGPLFEYACHEGNRGMVNILSFARAEEQASPESRP